MAVHAPKPRVQEAKSQAQSPLFSVLPGEVRNLIYEFALSDYEDPNDVYSNDTCFKRPGYFARRRTDTDLLRACQRVYQEAWFIPWTSRQHTIYFTASGRKPHQSTTQIEMEIALKKIFELHGEQATEISNIRVIPQLYQLESGDRLSKLFAIHHFNPKYFTITIRHTDWWYWENDRPLHIDSKFVNRCKFPDSVTEIRLELESVERRRPQIQDIARQMREKWMFRTVNGKLLTASEGIPDEIMKWKGSSIWGGSRWVRDETDIETLEYYVQTVRFRVSSNTSNESRLESAPTLDACGFEPLSMRGSVGLKQLESRGIDSGFEASEIYRFLDKYRYRCQCVQSDNLQLAGLPQPNFCCGSGLGAGWIDSDVVSPNGSSWHCQNCQVR